MTTPVAITATAVRCALGEDRAAIAEALAAGRSAIGPVRGFDASGFGAALAAQIWTEGETDEDDPALRILGPHGRILEGVIRAVHGAAGIETERRERIGLYVGMGMVDAAVADLVPAAAASRDAGGALDLKKFFGGNYRMIHPLWPLSMLNNVAVGQIATDLDVRGDNLVLASDAVGGVRALLEGARAVREDIVDAAIVAGVSERVCPASLARRQLAGEPRPLGEGGAALVLAPDHPAATLRLLGGATTFGANASERATARALDLSGVGTAQRLESRVSAVGDLGAGRAAFLIALADATLEPGEVGLIRVRGTGRSAGALIVERPRMRFLLFDRVLEVVPGKRIHGVKTVTLTEPYFDGHFTRAPLVPGPLLVEAMIQLLAWTAITKHEFQLSCVLSVLEDVSLPPKLGPGHKIDLHGQLLGTNPKGSIGRAWAEIEGEEIARVGRVIYGHVPHPDPDVLRERFRYYGGPA